jgi:cytochrome P450
MEFDPLSADFFDDPYDTYRWLRDEAPVYHNERYGFWALSRFVDVVAAHRDWKTFSSEHGLTIDQLTNPDSPVKGTSIIMMDPPDHDRMRKLVSRVFTPRAMAALEPVVRDVITAHLAPLDGADAFDAVADFSACPRPTASRSASGPTSCSTASPATRHRRGRGSRPRWTRSSTSSSSSPTSARTRATT